MHMVAMFLFMTAPLWGVVLFFLLPTAIAAPLYAVAVVMAVISHRMMARATHRRAMTGPESFAGKTCTVVAWGAEGGTVQCDGDLWAATAETPLHPRPGDRLRVVGIEDLTLRVATDPEHPRSSAQP